MSSDAVACPVHGQTLKRKVCPTCNAAYMRDYLRKRRQNRPAKELLSRARKRARRMNIPFAISLDEIVIPSACPALGIPLTVGGGRSYNSPSLDRIVPSRGYVHGNVRVISDRANRLKGASDIDDLERKFRNAPGALKDDYRRVIAYVERELLLADARSNASMRISKRSDWQRAASVLEKICIHGSVVEAPTEYPSNV